MSDNNLTSEWLYIVLTVIALIASLFKKNNAKKVHSQPVLPREEDTSYYIEEEEDTEEEMEPFENKSGYSFDPAKEGGPIFVSPVIEEQEEEKETDFDLKKAIIYSEILNRKY